MPTVSVARGKQNAHDDITSTQISFGAGWEHYGFLAMDNADV